VYFLKQKHLVKKRVMKQKIYLSIPEPCHENWDKMTPQDQGRFCMNCSKVVVDFTEMSNTQILNYVQKSSNTCGRFLHSQINTALTAPAPSKFSWPYLWKLLVSGSLLLKATSSKAQGTPTLNKSSHINYSLQSNAVTSKIIVKESVSKLLIQRATVEIIHQGIKHMTITDSAGSFTIPKFMKGKICISISSVGYKTSSFLIDTKNLFENNNTLFLEKKFSELEVAMVTSTMCVGRISCMSGEQRKISLKKLFNLNDTIKRIIAAPAVSKLKVNPNPIKPNQPFTISYKAATKNGYTLHITTLEGKTILTQTVQMQKGYNQFSISLAQHASQQLIVSVINNKTKLIDSEKVLMLQ
jgi:hypothetical protein